MTTVRAATPAKAQIEGMLYMSYVQAAVYDAVTAIKGRYKPYHSIGLTAPGASPRAAVASAAYTTLAYYFPAQAASLDDDVHRLPEQDPVGSSRSGQAGRRRRRGRCRS